VGGILLAVKALNLPVLYSHPVNIALKLEQRRSLLSKNGMPVITFPGSWTIFNHQAPAGTIWGNGGYSAF
jgi:hypothetical protein